MMQIESQPAARPGVAHSADLLVAAMAGLLSLAGCSSGPTNPSAGERPDTNDASTQVTPDGGFTCPSGWTCGPTADAPSDAGAPSSDAGAPSDGALAADATYNTLLEADASFTLEQFQALCDGRGGFMYVNAACAGGSACKGLSFHSGDLWDHSCRGQNSECAGADCVDTPPDMGLTGRQIYEQGPCSGCHGNYNATTKKVDPSWYAIYYYTPDPNQVGPQFDAGTAPDYATALALYKAYPLETLESKIALGVSGTYSDGRGYSNMPMYYQTYSAAEIKRVAQYLQALQTTDGGPGLKPFGYGYPEYTYVALPDASAPGDAGATTDARGD
jgi:mono/diheme cytochrome c family protein